MILPLPVTFTTIGIDIGIDIPILPIYMGNGDNMSDSQYTYTKGHILVLGVVFFQIFFIPGRNFPIRHEKSMGSKGDPLLED